MNLSDAPTQTHPPDRQTYHVDGRSDVTKRLARTPPADGQFSVCCWNIERGHKLEEVSIILQESFVTHLHAITTHITLVARRTTTDNRAADVAERRRAGSERGTFTHSFTHSFSHPFIHSSIHH